MSMIARALGAIGAKRFLLVVAIVVSAGVIGLFATGLVALGELRVGGPVYTRIVLGKDLVADVLPPPEYLLEAYLEATLAIDDPKSVAKHAERLAQLRKDYDDRRAYWAGQAFDTTTKDMLLKESHAHATLFWSELDGNFLPALVRGDQVSARKSYEMLQNAYAAHRQVIDRIVTRANTDNAAFEVAANAENSFYTTLLWSAAVLVLVLAVGALFGIGTGIVNPLVAMTGAMRALAGGNKAVAVPGVGRKDEIGGLAGALQVFKDQAIEVDRMQAAARDAEKKAEEDKRRSMNALADGFQASVGEIVKSVAAASTQLQSTAQSLTATAEETSNQTTAVAAASEEAATNVQTVAAAAEELSASVQEISRQVSDAAQIAAKAVADARKTNATVQGLSDAAQKIGNVVQLIADIASQTNLLALNATIEAARAGDAGKGFAVVAAEVKNLATQTAKATEEIGDQIKAMQSVTNEAVTAIRTIGETIDKISQISTAIASAVEEQGAATKEIARNVDQAALGTKEVTRNIDGVSQAAVQTGKSAGEVLTATRGLTQSAGDMRTQIDEFLRKVKSA